MKIRNAAQLMMLATGMILIMTSGLRAQTMDEALLLFEESRTLISEGKTMKAISNLEKVIEITSQLGEAGEVLRSQAAGAIPNLYYNYAKELFDEGKLDASIEAYEKTMAVAQQYNDEDTYNMTRGVLAQLFLKNGNDKFRAREFEAALVDLDRALSFDSTNTNALLISAYSHRRLENTAEMISYFKAVIAAGRPNERNVTTSRDALMTHYMNTGARMINAKNTTEGLLLLDTAATFNESADLHYYYAVGFNAEERWDDAIASAEKALSMEPNNLENAARNQFEIGTAWYGKKDTPKACAAYKEANFGRTAIRAEQMIKALGCK
jgi:tetratricopeptide (TPR) repeat protein